ncbi:MAG: transposase [Myxococcota bacterium]
MDLLARLCALIPPPRMHMVRYHGVLASRSKLRAEVVPEPSTPEVDPMQLQAELELELGDEHHPRRKPWAWLLRHVFEEDVSICPRCAGPTSWLEVATEPDAIARAMADHGLAPAGRLPSPSAGPHPTSSSHL